jgi:hypothetical protein
MGRHGHNKLRRLRDEMRCRRPSVGNPDAAILLSRVVVDGAPVSDARALAREGATIAYRINVPTREAAKGSGSSKGLPAVR